jgi:hypothetical protein
MALTTPRGNNEGAYLITNLDGTVFYAMPVVPVNDDGSRAAGGGTGGGGASTIADGADVAEGAKADSAAAPTAPITTGPFSVVALLKGILNATLGFLTATTDRSGSATTTSGGLSVAANANRRFLVGQNISAVNIGFNEQGGTAAIGTAGTYTVPAGQSFAISSNKLINFIAASGTASITMTEG